MNLLKMLSDSILRERFNSTLDKWRNSSALIRSIYRNVDYDKTLEMLFEFAIKGLLSLKKNPFITCLVLVFIGTFFIDLQWFGFLADSSYIVDSSSDCLIVSNPVITFECGLEGLALGGLLGGIASGSASLLGSAISSSATSSSVYDTNRMNRQIAKETNATNKEIAEKTNEQNYNIWKEALGQRQQEIMYNDPSLQRARLEAAGYNPYLSMGQVSSGNVDSLLGADSPTMQGATMQTGAPMQAMDYSAWENLGGIPQQLADIRLKNSQSSLNETDNLTKLQRDIQDLENLRKKGHLTDDESLKVRADTYRLYKLLGKEMKLKDAEIEQKWSEVAKNSADTGFLEAQTRLQNILTQWAPQLQQAQLNNILASTKSANAQAFAAYSQGQLSLANVKVATEQAFKTACEKEGVQLNNKQVKQLTPILVNNAKKTGEKLDAEIAKEWNEATSNNFGPFGKISHGSAVQKNRDKYKDYH